MAYLYVFYLLMTLCTLMFYQKLDIFTSLLTFKGIRKPLFRQCQKSAYEVHFISGTIYNMELKFLQVNYEHLDCDLTQGFLLTVSVNSGLSG